MEAEANMKIETLQRRIEALEKAIAATRHDLEVVQAASRDRGVWRNLDGDLLSISGMNDTHLINAIRVCERMDSRYGWNPERMQSFADLVREALRRGLEWR